MSDFLFTSRPRPPGALRRILERYLGPVMTECAEYHGEWGSLAVAQGFHDREVVVEDERVLSVLVGEPIVRIGPGSPGPARNDGRLRAVHALLQTEERVAWDEHLDGAFAALSIDKRRGTGLAVSDLASFVPMFAAEVVRTAAGELVLGTHVDCVAWAAGLNREVDLVSAADLVVNLTSTFPHTLYLGVEQFPPATARRFDPRGWGDEEAVYWRPEEKQAYASVREAAVALREGFTEDVRLASTEFPHVGLLLSGGEDARAVLAAVPEEVKVWAFTFADWENREVRIARRIARIHGAEFVFGRRAPTHYLDGFPDVSAFVGSNQLFMDVHGYGFHESLGIRELPQVLGGLSADTFLKGLKAERGAGRRGAGALPFPLPRAPLIRPELLQEVGERRTKFRRWLAEIRPGSVTEWEKLWPYSMSKHAANLHGNRRIFASHEPFHSNAVVKLAATVPLSWKRSRALFHRAMRPLFRKSWHVPHTRYRYPFFGRYSNVPLVGGLAVARGVRALLTGQLRARHAPWPKWGAVAASEAMTQRKGEYPVLESPLRYLFVPAPPEEIDRVVRRWYPLRQLLLLQLSYLTSLAKQR